MGATVHKPAGQPDGGQFASTGHSDDVPALAVLAADPAMEAVAAAAVLRRTAIQEKKWELDQQIAVQSAVALAARARSIFPDAKFVMFRGNAGDLEGIVPDSILDANGDTIASSDDWDSRADYYRWEGDGDEAGNAHLLAADLQNHDGKLQDVFAQGTGSLHRYTYVTLDIDKALEQDSL